VVSLPRSQKGVRASSNPKPWGDVRRNLGRGDKGLILPYWPINLTCLHKL